MNKSGLCGGIAVAGLFFAIPMYAQITPSICDQIPGNLVQNCGFETLGPDGTTPGSPIPDWTESNWTTNDSVTNIAADVNSGSYALAMGNSFAQGAAGISQTFADVAGSQYQFTFYLFNGAAGAQSPGVQQFNAYWDSTAGTPIFSDSTAGDPGTYTEESFSVVGTGSDTITFTAINGPAFYFLDDVSVVATPEPNSLFLIGAALSLAGIAATARAYKRRRASLIP